MRSENGAAIADRNDRVIADRDRVAVCVEAAVKLWIRNLYEQRQIFFVYYRFLFFFVDNLIYVEST